MKELIRVYWETDTLTGSMIDDESVRDDYEDEEGYTIEDVTIDDCSGAELAEYLDREAESGNAHALIIHQSLHDLVCSEIGMDAAKTLMVALLECGGLQSL